MSYKIEDFENDKRVRFTIKVPLSLIRKLQVTVGHKSGGVTGHITNRMATIIESENYQIKLEQYFDKHHPDKKSRWEKLLLRYWKKNDRT